MALRLATTSKNPTDGGPDRSRSQASLATAHHYAAMLLQRQDFDGWRKQFAATAENEDVHERYIVRCNLIRTVLSVQKLSHSALASAMIAAAAELTTALEAEPREPVFLNWAGVLYYELGATRSAEALFKAARRLDPALPDVRRNIRACKARRQQGSRVLDSLPPAVLRELRGLGPRAERIARAARPAGGMTLSLCMIVKDEQEMLPRCLEAVHKWVDELIIVDTGSHDRTVEIAESFGAKVLHHEWTGDFSEARNVGWDAATCDWKMYLDADEVLVDGEGPRLRELLGHVWREAIYLTETNFTGELDHGTSVDHNALRIFRNRPEYRFKDRIHEQLAYALPEIDERREVSNVRVEHYGYLGVVREERSKSDRNMELLRTQIAEGSASPFPRYNLASEYLAIDEFEKALPYFQEAWEIMERDPDRLGYPYFSSLTYRYVRTLVRLGRFERAEELITLGLQLLPGYTDLLLELGYSYRDQQRYAEAAEVFRRALKMGDAPTRYAGARGAGSYLARQALAETLYHQGRYVEAADELRACLRDHSGFLAAVQPLAMCLLVAGEDARKVRAEIDSLVDGLSPAGLFLLAVPFYERGEIAIAEEALRESLAARPDAPRVQMALVEALLSRSAFAEAEEMADRIAADTPIGKLAAPSRLFAACADPERSEERYEAACDYAVAAGIPGEQLDLFAAWWKGGKAEPNSLDESVAPLLVVMLSALARIEAFDQFERLTAVLDGLRMPARERTELLACVLLERGFLELAADIWIGSIETDGPDRRSMLGLAAVAELREMPDDAAMFRTEADRLAA